MSTCFGTTGSKGLLPSPVFGNLISKTRLAITISLLRVTCVQSAENLHSVDFFAGEQSVKKGYGAKPRLHSLQSSSSLDQHPDLFTHQNDSCWVEAGMWSLIPQYWIALSQPMNRLKRFPETNPHNITSSFPPRFMKFWWCNAVQVFVVEWKWTIEPQLTSFFKLVFLLWTWYTVLY